MNAGPWAPRAPLGLAIVVTVFGAAQQVLAGGISGAFTAGLVFTTSAVVVALVAIDD